MSIEQNKTIARRIFTQVNDDQQYDALNELCHSDILIHDPLSGNQQGIEAFRGLLAFFRTAFGEQKTDLHQVVAEGDFVAILHTHNAVHTGPFMGLPPTQKHASVPGIELFRLREGKIAEFWRFDADLSLLMQLGAIPTPQGA